MMNAKFLIAAIVLGGLAAAAAGQVTPAPKPAPKPAPAPQPTKKVPPGAFQRPGWWVAADLSDAELFDAMAAIESVDKWAVSLPPYLPPPDLDDLVWQEALGQQNVKPATWPMPQGLIVPLIPQLDKNTGGVAWAISVLLFQALLRAGKLTPAEAKALYDTRRAEYVKRGYPSFPPASLA